MWHSVARRATCRLAGDAPEQVRVVRGRGRENADGPGRRGHVEPWSALEIRDRGAGSLGDEPRSRDVPGGEPALLDEGIEPAICDIGEPEGRRTHRARHP